MDRPMTLDALRTAPEGMDSAEDALDAIVFASEGFRGEDVDVIRARDAQHNVLRKRLQERIAEAVKVLRKMSGSHSPGCAIAVNVRHGCTCHVELKDAALAALEKP